MKSSENRYVGVDEKESNFKSLGRPSRLDKENLGKLLYAYYSYPYSLRRLADMFGVSRMTVWRALNKMLA